MLDHPKITAEEIINLFNKAKQEASLLSLPTYHPLIVSDKTEIRDEYKKEMTKASFKNVLKDESTLGDVRYE